MTNKTNIGSETYPKAKRQPFNRCLIENMSEENLMNHVRECPIKIFGEDNFVRLPPFQRFVDWYARLEELVSSVEKSEKSGSISDTLMTRNGNKMIEKILAVLQSYKVNEETQAGTKGNVIWEDDFIFVAVELIKLMQPTPQELKDMKAGYIELAK